MNTQPDTKLTVRYADQVVGKHSFNNEILEVLLYKVAMATVVGLTIRVATAVVAIACHP